MIQKVLFCGGRDYIDLHEVTKAMAKLETATKDQLIVIAGGARGADTIAAQVAQSHGIHTAVVKALWHAFGKSAGYRRNETMIAGLKPHLVVAFPGGKGTQHSIDIAEKHGIEVWRPCE